MQTLRSYAVPGSSDAVKEADPVIRSELGIAPKLYKPQPLVKEESVPRKKKRRRPLKGGTGLCGQEGMWKRRTVSGG
jgi:hypothetical protein